MPSTTYFNLAGHDGREARTSIERCGMLNVMAAQWFSPGLA